MIESLQSVRLLGTESGETTNRELGRREERSRSDGTPESGL